MSLLATFLVLSALGVIDAGYLFYSHRKAKPLICPLDHPCDVVTESRWAAMFGVRNETLGLLFYLAVFAGGLGILLFPAYAPLLAQLLFWGTLAGLAFSLFLVYLQIYAIRNYCFYCMISAGITLLLFLNSIALR